MSQSVVKIDPEIMSGAPCFAGTRVPIQNLIDYLDGGDSIDDFLEGFPTVSREQVIAFLEEAKESVLARAVGRFCSTNASIDGWRATLPYIRLRQCLAVVGLASKW